MKEKYWNPLAKAWVKDGVDDPELTVIKVKAKCVVVTLFRSLVNWSRGDLAAEAGEGVRSAH